LQEAAVSLPPRIRHPFMWLQFIEV